MAFLLPGFATDEAVHFRPNMHVHEQIRDSLKGAYAFDDVKRASFKGHRLRKV